MGEDHDIEVALDARDLPRVRRVLAAIESGEAEPCDPHLGAAIALMAMQSGDAAPADVVSHVLASEHFEFDTESREGDAAQLVPTAIALNRRDCLQALFDDGRFDLGDRVALALRVAIDNGYDEVFEMVVGHPGFDPPPGRVIEYFHGSVRRGSPANIRALLRHEHLNPTADHLTFAIKQLNDAVFDILMEDGRANVNGALEYAGTVNAFTPWWVRSEAHQVPDGKPLRAAAAQGRIGIVRTLLRHPDIIPNIHHSAPLRMAAVEGHPEVVARLLEDARDRLAVGDARGVDPAALGSQALENAASRGMFASVWHLLEDRKIRALKGFPPGVDPTTNGHLALRSALKKLCNDSNACSGLYDYAGIVRALLAFKPAEEIISLVRTEAHNLFHIATVALSIPALELLVEHVGKDAARMYFRTLYSWSGVVRSTQGDAGKKHAVREYLQTLSDS